VACFLFNRDQDGVVNIDPNPNCWDDAFTLTLEMSGDANPGATYDVVNPFDGTQNIQVSSSLAYDTSVENVIGSWTGTQYTATYPDVTTGGGMYFVALKDPDLIPGPWEPFGGVYLRAFKTAGGACNVRTELVHLVDIDPGPGYWYAWVVEGVNADCTLDQLADNRTDVLGTP
jgi:hypothetical protein